MAKTTAPFNAFSITPIFKDGDDKEAIAIDICGVEEPLDCTRIEAGTPAFAAAEYLIRLIDRTTVETEPLDNTGE